MKFSLRTALFLLFALCALAAANGIAAEAARQTLSLIGPWDFYPNGAEPKHEIRVPSFWDAPLDYGYPAEWSNLQHGVYRKELQIPPSMRDKEIFLSIRRVSVLAKVRINGRQAGAEDSGGYLMMQLPYLIDITPYVKWEKSNSIEVSVWGGTNIPFQGNMEDTFIDERDYPPDAMDGAHLLYPCGVDNWDGRRGINGDVALVAYPKTYVSDVCVTTDLHKQRNALKNEVTLRMTLVNKDGEKHKIRMFNRATLIGGNSAKDLESPEVELPPNSTLDVTIPNVSWTNAVLWWPDDPRLYSLETTLVEDGKVIDTCRTRFGVRQFYVQGDHYEINGTRVNLRGDAYEFSWHEDYRHGPSTAPVFSTKELFPAYQERLVREYQKLNNNVLRAHKASGIDELYDTCDEIGMMVLDEAPFWEAWLRTDERGKTNFEAWDRRWIKERRNHPSIVAWVAANECWYGPTGMYSVQAVRAMDSTRPVFQDDPWGPHPHRDPLEPYPGDELCHHYTGGYPYEQLNSENIYDIYHADLFKPTGEGEAMYADGWPLMNSDGSLSGKQTQDGEFGNPDMITQSQWLHAVSRIIRAMRYAGLSDSRLYGDWMYAFDPFETKLKIQWPDPSAPGLQPIALNRPILDLTGGRFESVRYNDGREYYRNSLAPLAVFDKEFDRQDRIGATPPIFRGEERLNRTLIVYNDTLRGGQEIHVGWAAESNGRTLAHGAFDLHVPYGERREREIEIKLPRELKRGQWLNLVLTATQPGGARFSETNRLGALLELPPPQLAVEPGNIDLGALSLDDLSQWHVVRLKNHGGGSSEPWRLYGGDDAIHFNLTSGNLRGEQEIYFQILTNGLVPGPARKTIQFAGANGASARLTIQYNAPEMARP